MKFTAKQIASIVNGSIVGDANIEVYKPSKIEEGSKGSISFLSNTKYNHFIYTTEASVVIINEGFTLEKEVKPTLIRVQDANKSFSQLLEYYETLIVEEAGISEFVSIDKSVDVDSSCYVGEFTVIKKNVHLGKNVKIYPQVFIGEGVVIGDNTRIMPGVKIMQGTKIGNNCIIKSGSIIGSDGFGFAPQGDKTYKRTPQIGTVVIGDNVSVGANTTIDRATLGETVIKDGVKLDNQIQIAHNVEIGKNTVIAAQTGIAGSTKIGESCMLGGQVGIVGHLKIGNRVQIQAKSGVAKSAKDNAMLRGNPAFEYNNYSKSYIYFKQLPSIVKRLEQLEKKESEK